jgi:hypothetical protein
MVYSVEQNTFVVVFYFRNGKFINGELSVSKNEFQQNSGQHSRLLFVNSYS